MKPETALAAVFLIVVFALAGACEVAKWRECRRYHPAWYCIARGSN